MACLTNDTHIGKGEVLLQGGNQVHISLVVLTLFIRVAIVIVGKWAQRHDPVGRSIAETRYGGVCTLLQIAEAYNIAKGLYGVQNAVCARKRLQEPVHLQVLIHPQRIECGGIEARQEHIDHNKQVELLVLHPQGYILIVALEIIAIGAVIGVEHQIIVADSHIEEIA